MASAAAPLPVEIRDDPVLLACYLALDNAGISGCDIAQLRAEGVPLVTRGGRSLDGALSSCPHFMEIGQRYFLLSIVGAQLKSKEAALASVPANQSSQSDRTSYSQQVHEENSLVLDTPKVTKESCSLKALSEEDNVGSKMFQLGSSRETEGLGLKFEHLLETKREQRWSRRPRSYHLEGQTALDFSEEDGGRRGVQRTGYFKMQDEGQKRRERMFLGLSLSLDLNALPTDELAEGSIDQEKSNPVRGECLLPFFPLNQPALLPEDQEMHVDAQRSTATGEAEGTAPLPKKALSFEPQALSLSPAGPTKWSGNCGNLLACKRPVEQSFSKTVLDAPQHSNHRLPEEKPADEQQKLDVLGMLQAYDSDEESESELFQSDVDTFWKGKLPLDSTSEQKEASSTSSDDSDEINERLEGRKRLVKRRKLELSFGDLDQEESRLAKKRKGTAESERGSGREESESLQEEEATLVRCKSCKEWAEPGKKLCTFHNPWTKRRQAARKDEVHVEAFEEVQKAVAKKHVASTENKSRDGKRTDEEAKSRKRSHLQDESDSNEGPPKRGLAAGVQQSGEGEGAPRCKHNSNTCQEPPMVGFKLCEKHYFCVPGRKKKQKGGEAGTSAGSAQQEKAVETQGAQRVQWYKEDVAARAVRRALNKKRGQRNEEVLEFAVSESESDESTFETSPPEQQESMGSENLGTADSGAEDGTAFRQCAERQVRGGKLDWQCREEAMTGKLRCEYHTEAQGRRYKQRRKRIRMQRALKAAKQVRVCVGDGRCAERSCSARAVEGKNRCAKHVAMHRQGNLKFLEKTRALRGLKATGALGKDRKVNGNSGALPCAEYCMKDGNVNWRCKLTAAEGHHLCEKHGAMRKRGYLRSLEKAKVQRASHSTAEAGSQEEFETTEAAKPLPANQPAVVRCSHRYLSKGKVKRRCFASCLEGRSHCEKHCEMRKTSALNAAGKQLGMGVETRSGTRASELEGQRRCVQRQIVFGKETWRCKENAAPGKERCENHIDKMKRKMQRQREQRSLIAKANEEDKSEGDWREGRGTRRTALAREGSHQLGARSSKRLKASTKPQSADAIQEPQQCGHALRSHGRLLCDCKKHAAPGESKCAYHIEMLRAKEARRRKRQMGRLAAEDASEHCLKQLGARREAKAIIGTENRQQEEGLGLEEDERCVQYKKKSWRCTARRMEGKNRCERHVALQKKYQTTWWQKIRASRLSDGRSNQKTRPEEGTAKGTGGRLKGKNPKGQRTQGEAILALAAPPASSKAVRKRRSDAPQSATCQPEASPDSAKSRGPTVAWPAGFSERKQSAKPCPNFPDVCPKLHKPSSGTCALCASVQNVSREETPAGERRLGATAKSVGQLASNEDEVDEELEQGLSSRGTLSGLDPGGPSRDAESKRAALSSKTNAGPSDLNGQLAPGRSQSGPTDRAVEGNATCVSDDRDGQRRLESDQGNVSVREPLETVDEPDQKPLPTVGSDQDVQESSEAHEAVQRPLAGSKKDSVWERPEAVRSGKGTQERPGTVRPGENAMKPPGPVRTDGAAPDRTSGQDSTATKRHTQTAAGAPAVDEHALQRIAEKFAQRAGNAGLDAQAARKYLLELGRQALLRMYLEERAKDKPQA